MKNLDQIWNKLASETTPLVAIILILAGVLLLYQFLIVLIGPLCIGLGVWYLWSQSNENEDKTDSK